MLHQKVVFNRFYIMIIFVPFFILYSACSGGGGNESPADSVQLPEQNNVSGTWNIIETIDDTQCEGAPHTSYDYFTINVSQRGHTITINDEDGNHYSGRLNGNTLSWSGNLERNGGTLTIISSSLTFSGNTVTGTAEWNWSDSNRTCSGTTQVKGDRP